MYFFFVKPVINYYYLKKINFNIYFLHFYFKKFRLVIGILALFVQAMLSKVSEATVEVKKYLLDNSINEYCWTWKYVDIWVVSVNKQTALHISLNNTGSSGEIFVGEWTSADSSLTDDNWKRASVGKWSTYNWVKTVWANSSLCVRLYANPGGTVVWNALIYENLNVISKTISTHKSLPRELKEIWFKATSTLYGYHTNNTWYTGE